MSKLTDRKVHNLKIPGRYADGDTLYLMVWPAGGKSWVQRLTVEGRRADLGLGSYPAVSLAEARHKALDNRALAKSGGNPLSVKRAEEKQVAMPTFETLAQQHIEEHSHSWRNAKHRAQWLSSLQSYAFPTIGGLKVNEISRKHVVEALSPIWIAKPETARRVRQRIRAVMDRAVALEYADYNPAGDAMNGALTKLPRVKAHHRAPPYKELPSILQTVRESTASLVVKLGFELLVLTASRLENLEARFGRKWIWIRLRGRFSETE